MTAYAYAYVEIGPTPADEPCTQLGEEGYESRSRKECQRFIAAIRAKLGPEPEGAKLVVKSNRHDYGTYHEVACRYEEGNRRAEAYAWRCESNAPTRWPSAEEEVGS